jgi:hypothetical protein
MSFLSHTKSNQLINQIVIEVVTIDILYRRLGHTGLPKLRTTIKQIGIEVADKEFYCPSYTIVKSKKKVSHIHQAHTEKAGDYFHANLQTISPKGFDTEHPRHYRGFKYTIVIADNKTQCRWVICLRTKDKAT